MWKPTSKFIFLYYVLRINIFYIKKILLNSLENFNLNNTIYINKKIKLYKN